MRRFFVVEVTGEGRMPVAPPSERQTELRTASVVHTPALPFATETAMCFYFCILNYFSNWSSKCLTIITIIGDL